MPVRALQGGDIAESARGAGAVADVGGRQVNHEKPPIGIDGDVALAAEYCLAGVVTPCFKYGEP